MPFLAYRLVASVRWRLCWSYAAIWSTSFPCWYPSAHGAGCWSVTVCCHCPHVV